MNDLPTELRYYGKEMGYGALFGFLATLLTVTFTLLVYYLGIDLFLLLFPFFLGIQVMYFLLYSFWILWFGFSPSYQAISQKIFKRKPREISERDLTGKGIRYLVSGIVMIILFDLAVSLVFKLS